MILKPSGKFYCVMDVGPGAGEFGGKIVAHGTPQSIKKNSTGKYLRISSKTNLNNLTKEFLKIEGAYLNTSDY